MSDNEKTLIVKQMSCKINYFPINFLIYGHALIKIKRLSKIQQIEKKMLHNL